MTAAVIVEATSVRKRWGRTEALRDATFTIGAGVTGLLGSNGAGKTTTLGLVLGFHRPDGGAIRVLGRDPWASGPVVRSRIGYAPEHDAMPPDVSAHDLVRHIAELHGLPRREATARASDTLYEVGLGEERFRHIGTMSTGQRQRVKLAQAIAHDPDLVLLDEPTNGLDPVQREQMLALVRRVGTELGLNVVLSSHLLDEVERVSDSVVILDDGRAVASGSLGELRGDSGALVVEVDGDGCAPLADALRRRGQQVEVIERRVVVTVEGDATYDAVRDAVADLELPLRRLSRRQASLEDVYLLGTGGGVEP